jgi:hypothetical protein
MQALESTVTAGRNTTAFSLMASIPSWWRDRMPYQHHWGLVTPYETKDAGMYQEQTSIQPLFCWVHVMKDVLRSLGPILHLHEGHQPCVPTPKPWFICSIWHHSNYPKKCFILEQEGTLDVTWLLPLEGRCMHFETAKGNYWCLVPPLSEISTFQCNAPPPPLPSYFHKAQDSCTAQWNVYWNYEKCCFLGCGTV